MTQYSNDGKVALWKGQSDSEGAPVLKGNVYAHRDIARGEKLDIALWKNDNANENAPVLQGKLGDVFKKTNTGYDTPTQPKADGFRQEVPPAYADEDLDDIPF